MNNPKMPKILPFDIYRWISLAILIICAGGIAGLVMYPSDSIIVSIIAYGVLGVTGTKQVIDLFKIHIKEKSFYRAINMAEKVFQEKCSEAEEEDE